MFKKINTFYFSRILLFSYIICPFLYATGEADIEDGYARVRIWSESLPEGKVGHVSLATQKSYISLWPISSDTAAKHVDHGGSQYVVEAPACNIETYIKDLEQEENVEPDHVYTILLPEVNSLDTIWQYIKTTHSHDMGGSCVSLSGVTWLAPSQTISKNLSYNCASAALSALNLGGLDVNPFIRNKIATQNLTRTASQLLQQTEDKEMKKLIQSGILYGAYSGIIKPDDIGSFLDGHIKSRYKHILNTDITNNRLKTNISDITHSDIEVISEKLLEGERKYYDNPYNHILRDFRRLGCTVTQIPQEEGSYNIILSSAIITAVREARHLKEQLMLGGVVIGGVGIAVGIASAINGDCIIS